MDGADLNRVHAEGADLRDADLSRARLTSAQFDEADLRGVRWDGALLRRTDLSGADLRGARGLTPESLALACGDDRTRLPADLVIRDCK
jgi:uncharacterized protein YjbI with pentapeptide repeats